MKQIIIVDDRIPQAAKSNFQKLGELVPVSSTSVVYEAISGHPDIFICKTDKGLIVAPNSPIDLIECLNKRNVKMIRGEKLLGNSYPDTAYYNAVITPNYIIHNTKYTDPELYDASSHLETIHVNQAYCRCTTLALKGDRFITSDRGIEKVLILRGLEVLYVNPDAIVLPGFKHGFFGGTCGINKNKVYFIGNLDYLPDGHRVRTYLSDYDIIELADHPLFDGGSLIFPD